MDLYSRQEPAPAWGPPPQRPTSPSSHRVSTDNLSDPAVQAPPTLGSEAPSVKRTEEDKPAGVVTDDGHVDIDDDHVPHRDKLGKDQSLLAQIMKMDDGLNIKGIHFSIQ